MTALYIIGGIVLFFVLIFLLPIGLWMEYSAEGFHLKVKLWFFTLVVVPGGEPSEKKKLKLEKKKQEKKEKKAQKAKERPKEKKGGLVKTFFAMRADIFKALGKLGKGLKINKLKVWYLAAAEDAAAAALQFGRMSAAMGAVTALLENLFKVKKKDYRLNVSFEKQEPEVYIEGRISLRIGRIVGIGLGLLTSFIKHSPKPQLPEKPARKEEKPISETRKGGLQNG